MLPTVLLSYKTYRHTASKLKYAAFMPLFSMICSATALRRVDENFRLEGPISEVPFRTESGSTRKQGGKCGGQDSVDLVLGFHQRPEAWLAGNWNFAEGPCEVQARPLNNGDFEIRLSYLPAPGRRGPQEIQILTFSTTDSYVVDHWLGTREKNKPVAAKKKPGKAATGKEASSASPLKGASDQSLGNAFDDANSWKKLLGSAASASDFNSPELNRFRAPDRERNTQLSPEPVERRPLKLPLLDIPSMRGDVAFNEEPFEWFEFSEADISIHGAHDAQANARAVNGVVDGVNYIVLLAKKEEWLKALKAMEILEKSEFAKNLPLKDARWWALKGLIHFKLSDRFNDQALRNKGFDVWREGLRLTAGQGGASQEYVEYMVIENVRRLMGVEQSYAALSLLLWAQRFAWSTRAEERFSFLKAEVYFRLSIFDEAKKLFGEYFSRRAQIPLSAAVDRRLVPAAAFRLGDIELVNKRFTEAIAEYSRALLEIPSTDKFSFEGAWYPELVKQFPQVLYNRAEASVRIGREQNALRDLRAFIFLAPNHVDVGLVYYRIGDLLSSLGAEDVQVQSAWRECIFRVPESLGARLCAARKAADEMVTVEKAQWPRLMMTVEEAEKSKTGAPWKGFARDDLKAFTSLILADAFIRNRAPTQALLRLEPVKKLEVTPYLKAWTDEYYLTAFAGYLDDLYKQNKFKEVVREYENRRRTFLYRQTRPEILWSLVRAYESLGLYKEARDLLGTALEMRTRLGRTELRPYEPTESQWFERRAEIELELLAMGRIAAPLVRVDLEKLDPLLAATQRHWIRYAQLTDNPKSEVEWWKKLEKNGALGWEQIGQYSRAIKKVGQQGEHARYLERTVGVWLSEKDALRKNGPDSELLYSLFESRVAAGDLERAMVVVEFLEQWDDKSLGANVPRAMLIFKKGETQNRMGKPNEARQSFNRAKALAPDSLWGKLATSAEKEIGTSPNGAR